MNYLRRSRIFRWISKMVGGPSAITIEWPSATSFVRRLSTGWGATRKYLRRLRRVWTVGSLRRSESERGRRRRYEGGAQAVKIV